MIEFLNTLQDYVKHHSSIRSRMVAQAADLIVLQIKEDLLELGAVHGDIRRLYNIILLKDLSKNHYNHLCAPYI